MNSYRVQNRAKGCKSLGRPRWRWKEPWPSPAPWQRGKRCPPPRARRGSPLPFRPAADLRAPQGHRAGGHSEKDSKDRHGQRRSAPEEGLGPAPAGSSAAPRSRRGLARPPPAQRPRRPRPSLRPGSASSGARPPPRAAAGRPLAAAVPPGRPAERPRCPLPGRRQAGRGGAAPRDKVPQSR